MSAPHVRKSLSAIVRGEGVAAQCCVHLLARGGLRVIAERTVRPRLPAIMLSEAALALIREVFENPGLFRSAHRITRRVVQWGREAEPVAVEHAAVVVSEPDLLSGLEQAPEPAVGGESLFTVFASRPLPAATVEQCFGSRTAHAAQIRLADTNDSSSCWIESLETGWLFLIPNSAESGWLLSVGDSPGTNLGRSTLVARRIASLSEPSAEFPASPRIVSPLSGAGWLACGTAGMAFDPICGDGTAHAVREGILAAAVVKGISTGGDAEELLRHYEARLILGFQRHLATSLNFYRSGYGGSWWDHESALFERGLEWCAGQMKGHGEFRYQLRGFELWPIDKNRP